jgi:type I restriction enzyme S subunit
VSLPPNWEPLVLGDVLRRIEAGKSFAAEPRPAKDEEWGVIKVSAMTYGVFREAENKAVPSGTKFASSAEIRPGDLLLSRANTRDYVGASILVGKCRPRLLLSDKSLRLHPASNVDRRWLWYALNTPKSRRYLSDASSGVKSGMRNISQRSLQSLPLNLPPLIEQRRVVDILDDHLSRIDAGGRLVAAALNRTNRLRQSILNSCLRAASSAEETRTATIGELATVETGATPLKARREYYADGTIPWVTSADLAQGLIKQPSQFITPAALTETSVKLFPAGTLLVAMYGEGKTRGSVAELAVEATTNQACAAIRLNDNDSNHRAWIRLALEANYWHMRRLASGGVQPNLNLTIVRAIRVPVPNNEVRTSLLQARDKAEQGRRRLESEAIRLKQRNDALRRSLLEAAFAGQLSGRASDADLIEEMAGV